MKTLLFDAYVPGDGALENSHWIAERTRERLGEQTIVLGHPDATRTNFEQTLRQHAPRGMAFFGHGDGGVAWAARLRPNASEAPTLSNTSEHGAVYGCDGEAALDHHNAHFFKERFCHLLACNVGFALGPAMLQGGASCFVAYETTITPEFEIGNLPTSLAELLTEVTTQTTSNLHEGVFDARTLKQTLHTAIEALESWFDSEEGIAWSEQQLFFLNVAGIRGFARQLERTMVVQCPDEFPQAFGTRVINEQQNAIFR